MFDLHYLSNLYWTILLVLPQSLIYILQLYLFSLRLTNDWPVLFTTVLSHISKTISLNEFERVWQTSTHFYRRQGCLRLFRIEEPTNEDPSGKDGWRVSVYLPFLDSSKRSYRSNKWRGSNSRYYIPTHVFTQRARKFLGTLKSATSFAKVFARMGEEVLSRGLDFIPRFIPSDQVFSFFFFSFFWFEEGENKFDGLKKIWKIFGNLNIRKLEALEN